MEFWPHLSRNCVLFPKKLRPTLKIMLSLEKMRKLTSIFSLSGKKGWPPKLSKIFTMSTKVKCSTCQVLSPLRPVHTSDFVAREERQFEWWYRTELCRRNLEHAQNLVQLSANFCCLIWPIRCCGNQEAMISPLESLVLSRDNESV